MTITYGITEEVYTMGTNSRLTFGIAAYADAETDGTATIVDAVHEITNDRAKLEAFVAACNREGLPLVHLDDVIEDFLD